MARQNRPAHAGLGGDRGNAGDHGFRRAAERLVPRQEHHGNTQKSCHIRIDRELRGKLPVDAHALDRCGHGMRQRIPAACRSAVVACKGDRVIPVLIQSAHHAEQVARPAANQPGGTRQSCRVKVACAVVRVLDRRFVAGQLRALDGGTDLPCHLPREIRVLLFSDLGLVPCVDACGALNVGAQVQFHGLILLFCRPENERAVHIGRVWGIGCALPPAHLRGSFLFRNTTSLLKI